MTHILTLRRLALLASASLFALATVAVPLTVDGPSAFKAAMAQSDPGGGGGDTDPGGGGGGEPDPGDGGGGGPKGNNGFGNGGSDGSPNGRDDTNR